MRIGNYSNQNNYALNNQKQNKAVAFGMYKIERAEGYVGKLPETEVISEFIANLFKKRNTLLGSLPSAERRAEEALNNTRYGDAARIRRIEDFTPDKFLPWYKQGRKIVISSNGPIYYAKLNGKKTKGYARTQQGAAENLIEKMLTAKLSKERSSYNPNSLSLITDVPRKPLSQIA